MINTRPLFLLLVAVCLCAAPGSFAQQPPAVESPEPAASNLPAEALDIPPAEASPAEVSDVAANVGDRPGKINFFALLVSGGAFMIPLLILSLIAVTAAIERFIGLRQSRVMPSGFVSALGQLGMSTAGFDPRKAYKICQQYPSSAATVVKAMLLKVGRPHSEVEHTVQETSQREAERLYSNVRWLNLSASVAPLIGLLGTVWGMIIAFHDLTLLEPSQNKAEFLAEGIYIALVTTLGGLLVAIPAAVVSHFLEGRIQKLFHRIDEMVFNILPQVEKFEGRVRFNRQGTDAEGESAEETVVPPPVPEKMPSA